MSRDVHGQLAELLCQIEHHLRAQSLWSGTKPSADKLASQEPFCIDTLSFVEWLQFVFLPRMSIIADAQLPLPINSQIAPMAQEYFRGQSADASNLCQLLLRFDQLIADASSAWQVPIRSQP